MKRAACLIAAAMICSLAMAQRAVDFASKFMDSCKGDTAIHCVTIGPKMMEQLTSEHLLMKFQTVLIIFIQILRLFQ